jgi:spore maturation protein CgeB
MNFAFFGSSLVSAYWNGAATYYRGLIRALAARGHTVTFYEPDAFGRQANRDMDDPDWARVVVYAPTVDAMARCLAEARRTADVVVKCSGVGVLDRELEAAVASLSGPSRVFWDVDAPATLESIQAAPDDPMRDHIPRFDAVCTYGGGEAVVSAYAALGARMCVPIYNALDPATHHPVEPDARFKADLAFLGNRLPDREARVEEFFLGGRRAPAGAPIPHRRQRMGRQDDAGERRLGRARLHPRPQRLQLHAPRGTQHQPRFHGPLRRLAADPHFRGGGRRRGDPVRPLGRH